jgi:hypothetical protein
MATVRNISSHPVDLTGGVTLAPQAQGAANPATAHEADLIANGLLIVVDGSTPAPPNPSVQVPTFIGGVQPDPPDYLWIETDATGATVALHDRHGPVVSAGSTTGRAWAANTAYKQGDLVTYSGGLYRANADFTSGSSFNGTNWTTVASLPGGGSTGQTLKKNSGTDGDASWSTPAQSFETTPSPDTGAGAAGTSNSFAHGDHSHPKSLLYDGHGLDDLNPVASSGSAITVPDPSVSQVSVVRLTANCGITMPTATAGARLRMALTQDATGSRVPTFPSNVAWISGAAPTWSTTAARTDLLEFMCLDGLNWFGWPLALGLVTPPSPLTVVQTVHTTSTNSSQATFASNLTAGSSVLALLGPQSSGVTVAPTGGGMSSWTKLATMSAAGIWNSAIPSTDHGEVWLGVGSTGGAGTATIQLGASCPDSMLLEIPRVNLEGTVQTASGTTTSATTFSTPTITAAGAGRMPFVVVATRGGTTGATPPGTPWVAGQAWNLNRGYPTGASEISWQFAYQTGSTNGQTYPSTWQSEFGTTQNWEAVAFFLKAY